MSEMPRHPLDEIMSEREVYEVYGKLLADKELREARQNGIIEWYDLRKGPHYTRDQVMKYLKLKERSACKENKPLGQQGEQNGKQIVSSNLGNSGSSKKEERGVIVGMNPALERRAASQLDAEI